MIQLSLTMLSVLGVLTSLCAVIMWDMSTLGGSIQSTKRDEYENVQLTTAESPRESTGLPLDPAFLK